MLEFFALQGTPMHFHLLVQYRDFASMSSNDEPRRGNCRYGVQGTEPQTGGVEQTAAYLRSEIDKWAKVVKAAGIKGE